MPFQIRVGSLIVIAKSAKDALRLFNKLNAGARTGARTEVCDMEGRTVKIEDLRKQSRT